MLARVEELEEENAQLIQGQSELSQLMTEFYSSMSAAEEAAGTLSVVEELSRDVDFKLNGLLPDLQNKINSVQSGRADIGEDLRSEQLRVVELEIELEERSKTVAATKEECDQLSAQVSQLVEEKASLEAQARFSAD